MINKQFRDEGRKQKNTKNKKLLNTFDHIIIFEHIHYKTVMKKIHNKSLYVIKRAYGIAIV